MDVREAIAKRKSVRAYVDRPLSDEDLKTIVEAGRWAPNSGPFLITVLRRPDLKQRLDEVTHRAMLESGVEFLQMRASLPGYRPLYGAPVVVLLTTPSDAPRGPMDCALSAANMILQATELGISSCFIVTPGLGLAAQPELATELGLPEGHAFQCAVLLGYPADRDPYSNPDRQPKGAVNYVD